MLLLAVWEMNPNEKRDLLEVAMQAVGRVLNDQQNRMFSNGALRPDQFPSDAFPNWVQLHWENTGKLHFVAVAEANRWTQIQTINALPVCISGNALDEFPAAPAELKQHVNGEPVPTLQTLFEHLDRALGVLRNDRRGRNEFEALAQKGDESLRDFARRVRKTGMLVYANKNAEQRDEQFRERFIEGLSNPDLLEVLLRENTRTFRETVDRAVDLQSIATSARTRQNRRVAYARLAQEPTVVVEDQIAVDEIKQQLKEMTCAMNSLTNMVNQFVGAVVNACRCDVCGGERHFEEESCRQRKNPSNLRGPRDRRRN